MKGWSIMLVALVATLVRTTETHAGCNVIPFDVERLNGAPPPSAFGGTRGRLTSPFLIPHQPLEITRRSCDKGPDFADTKPETLRTVVMLHGADGIPRALVLKRGVCTDDAFTKSCGKKLNDEARATCFTVPDAQYVVAPKNIKVDVPDPNPMTTPIRGTSGSVTVAVVEDSDDGKICAKLAMGASGQCDTAASDTATYPTLSACIDDIRKGGADECPTEPPHPLFTGPTLLPVQNDIHDVCASGTYCQLKSDELRYVVDRDGNALVPFSWKSSLDLCDNKCRKLTVRAEAKVPGATDFRDNDQGLLRNVWLQSYTYAGGRNYPAFAHVDSSSSSKRRQAFVGSAEEDLSVLRFATHFGACDTTANGCESTVDCNNATCKSLCRFDQGKSCTTSPQCQSGGCGKNFDYLSAYLGVTRWRLQRPPNTFCQDDPTTDCQSDDDCDCVSYVVDVDGCDCSNPKPGPTKSPDLAPASVASTNTAAPLIGGLGIDPAAGDAVVTQGASAEAMAVIVRRTALGASAPERCRTGDRETVLAVARSSQCGLAGHCAVICPDLGPGELVSELQVLRSQVRVLQRPAENDGPGFWDRFFAIFGIKRKATAVATDVASLRIVDLGNPAARVIPVADVVTSNPNYDPLVASASGGSTFLVKAGRCVTHDGRLLGIPSLCYPADTGECPPWASCQAADVVIAADLTLDADADGVPDAIDPSVHGLPVPP